MAASGIKDWEKVRKLILESYGLIAPKKTLAKLEGIAKPARKPATSRRPKPS